MTHFGRAFRRSVLVWSLGAVGLILFISAAGNARAEGAPFEERLSVYGVIKPGAITTLLAINNGIVSRIPAQLGQNVERGQSVIEVMERETTRSYRSGVKGGVAKLHVTEGAAVTPGMPLSTVMDPHSKQIEISLSPSEAARVHVGAAVRVRGGTAQFGTVTRLSGLVDPDTGAVVAFVKPDQKVERLIGDVMPLEVTLRAIEGCKRVPILDVDNYLDKFKVEAVSGGEACLKPKAT